MGFRTGSYAKVWEVDNKGKYSIVSISTSRKNKQTDQYETDFNSKFTRFIGQAHTDINNLEVGAKIKLGDVEVTNKYDKETKKEYTNFAVFSFEVAEYQDGGNPNKAQNSMDSFVQIPEDASDEIPFL